MGTDHHRAFDAWWEYAKDNYVTWDNGAPTGVDLYYDPVVNEHVGRGPIGLIAPTWYFAPQRPEVAKMGWQTAAAAAGLLADGPVLGLDDPATAVMLLQIAGEFADEGTRSRLWEAAEEHIEPTWDRDRGEFILGFKLNEPHPRGQYNARAMAGWVATPGAWSQIFNEPNLTKFDEPAVAGVDFPRIALSEARWDGRAMHLAAHPINEAAAATTTLMRLTNLTTTNGWTATGPGATVAPDGPNLEVRLAADNRPVIVHRL
jgi:hypothetical protein